MAEPLPSQPPGPRTPTAVAGGDRIVSRVDDAGPARAWHWTGVRTVRQVHGRVRRFVPARRNCPAGLRVCKGSVNSRPA